MPNPDLKPPKEILSQKVAEAGLGKAAERELVRARNQKFLETTKLDKLPPVRAVGRARDAIADARTKHDLEVIAKAQENIESNG